jgi:1,4-dihydroxy-2-naphthoyl-CoA hydrolase
MSIWRRPIDLAGFEAHAADTLIALLGIRLVEVGADFLRGAMPVDRRHVQPYGLLHGGASVVLSETLGSMACNLTLPEGRRCVGLEINANHVGMAVVGDTVVGECRPFHLGRSTQVWQTEIRLASGKLVCVSRLTCAVLEVPG